MVDRTAPDAHPNADPGASRDVRLDAPATAEPKQRWRLVVARELAAPAHAQREVAEAWEAALVAGGLPIAWTEGARARLRVSFGAPLATSMPAEGELIDVVLTERWPVWRVREALGGRVPFGWRLVDAHDVWLAGPPLAGRVAGADYRITLRGTDPGAEGAPGRPSVRARLAEACAAILASGALLRERARGGSTVQYDLRRLLLDVGVRRSTSPTDPIVLGTRTRFHPELGTGRPEEVVAALADVIGAPLAIESIVRERLILIEDLR